MRSMLKKYWNSYTTKGQFWLALGIAVLAVDASLSYQYGITQTTLHGIGFALVAVMFALLPDAARDEWEEGRKVSSVVLGLLCVPLGFVAYYSHIGYGAGVRVGDVQKTTVQNVKYEDARESVEDARRTLAMFENRLRDLENKQGWVATVSADSLRARLPALELAIKQEAARGGCKALCLQRTKERDDLNERIATIEARDDYTSRITAAKAVIERARAAAASTKHVQSSVVNQTNVGAQLWLTFSGHEASKAINPDQVTFSYVNIMIAAAGALAFMLLAPIGFFIAGRNRVAMREEHQTNSHPSTQALTPIEPSRPRVTYIEVGKAIFPKAA